MDDLDAGLVRGQLGTADLPVLRQIVRLFDEVESGRATAALRTELRLLLDTYGATPKGAQDRRWLKPKSAGPVPAPPTVGATPYAHLRVLTNG